MHADSQRALAAHHTAVRQRVMVTLLFALIVGAVLSVLWPTTISMIDTWNRTSTYSHCFLVIPIALWASWHQSPQLAGVPPTPFWPGLLLIAALGFVWLIGEIASAAIVSQFAAIAIVIAAALTVLGRHWARVLMFSLGLLLFAVPFGEELVPLLINRTADVTIEALRATGIPVYREGNDFVTPGGSWSMIEACSGVRYLIAALMTGCIFAWLQYRSIAKRLVFVALALAVALFANWLRSYAIVLIAHLSNNRLDAGINHNTWGWIVFGAAMFVLFALGARWSDTPRESAGLRSATSIAVPQAATLALIASIAMVAAWPAAASWFESRLDARAVKAEEIAARAGWLTASTPTSDWVPELVAPSAVHVQTFVREGRSVGVYMGIYRGQTQGAELANTMNQIAPSEGGRWRVVETGAEDIRVSGAPTSIMSARVRSVSGEVLVWQWYWIDGRATSSDLRVKLQLVRARLSGSIDTGAWVAVYTSIRGDTEAARRTLSEFVDAMSSSIDASLKATAAR